MPNGWLRKKRSSDRNVLWLFDASYLMRLDEEIHSTVIATEVEVPDP